MQTADLPDSHPLILAFPAMASYIAQSTGFWCPAACIHAVVPREKACAFHSQDKQSETAFAYIMIRRLKARGLRIPYRGL
jgi:hypothetical protein